MAFEVQNIVRHPDFDFAGGDEEVYNGANDIMILRLRNEVNLNIFTPICMPPPSVGSSLQLVGQEATLAGFGLIFWPETETDGEPILPAKLQELDQSLTLASSEGCLGWFEQQSQLNPNMTAWLGGLQDGNMFCASSEDGVSACFGDSGSPLIYQISPQVFEVLGVVSRGLGEAPCKDKYTVFGNVPYFHDWIVSEAGDVFYFNV